MASGWEVMSDKTAFGQWIKRLRAKRDWTQEALAEEVACAVQTIRSFENGSRRPSRPMAERLADILRVPDAEREEFLRLARLPVTEARAESSPDAAPSVTPGASPTTLPAPADTLVGREAERAVLARLLLSENRRLVTITGPGGVGKTRLAIEAARALAPKFDGRCAYVSLAAAHDPDAMPRALAGALRLKVDHDDEDAAQRIFAELGDAPVMLVFDNVEQLLGPAHATGTAHFFSGLLNAAPRAQLLVTSRERLRMRGEHVVELGGLGVADDEPAGARSESARLFIERARQLAPDFDPGPDDLRAIDRICRLLEGLPLGIELAAAWIRALSPQAIAAEVERSLDFLAHADRDRPERHRSTRAVLDHSWQLLGEGEQRALAGLAVFPAGFDRESAERVADASLAVLAGLIDKSLVRRRPAGDEGGAYELHGVLRQYLRDRLKEAGGWGAAQHAFAVHVADLVDRIGRPLLGHDSPDALSTLARHRADLHAVLDWSLVEGQDPELGARLAAALGRFWYLTNEWAYGSRWIALALDKRPADPATVARLLLRLGELRHALGDAAQACDLLRRSVALLGGQGDAPTLAWALLQYGYASSSHGDAAAAIDSLEKALALARELGDGWMTGTALSHLASARVTFGDYAEALAVGQACLNHFRAANARNSEAVAYNLLGRAHLGLGAVAPSRRYFDQALAIFGEPPQPAGMAWCRLNMGLAALVAEDAGVAEDHYRECLRLYVELENKGGVMAALVGMAAVAAATLQPERAVQLLAASHKLQTELGAVLTVQEQAERERAQARARAALTEAEYAAAWHLGELLLLEQAADLMLL